MPSCNVPIYYDSVIIQNVVCSVSGIGLSPQPTENPKRKMKSSTLRSVIIATSVIFAVALLCCITCISYRRVVAKGKGTDNIKSVKFIQILYSIKISIYKVHIYVLGSRSKYQKKSSPSVI